MIRITGLGVYLPGTRQSAAEIARSTGLPEQVVREKMGIVAKPVPGPQDHTNAMGIRAARAALADAGIAAGDIDLLVSMTEEHKEYPVWTAGIHAAHELGADRAWAFDIGQKCGSAILGLKLAADMMTVDSGVRNVLLCGGYRNGDLVDYANRDLSFLFDLAAGGGAAVLSRSGPGFAILGSAFVTDGSLANEVIVPVGGTVEPCDGTNAARRHFVAPNPERLRSRLRAVSMDRFEQVAREACRRSGVDVRTLRHVAVLHVKRSAHAEILDRLGLGPEHSIYLEDCGHVGQIDPLISLKRARDAGRFRDGDVALLLAAGIGYVWNAMCVRWQEE